MFQRRKRRYIRYSNRHPPVLCNKTTLIISNGLPAIYR
jgi:hypothetical protein